MKKFTFKLTLFLFPLVIFLILSEMYFSTITSIALKKKHFESSINNIETIFLGSSHTHRAININFITKASSNLAYAAQPISIDYYLLRKYLNNLKKLKTVVYELSIHRFYQDLNPKLWNGKIYKHLYSINYKNESFSITDYSFLLSDFQYYSSSFINYLNPFEERIILNNYGYDINFYKGRFYEYSYDSLKINSTYKSTINYFDKTLFNKNCEFLNKTIRLCKAHGIKIIFITTPYYKTYSSCIPSASIQEVNNVIKKYDLKYYNFSNSSFFNIRDFKDDNHLNPNGAVKFSLLLNKIIEHNDLSK